MKRTGFSVEQTAKRLPHNKTYPLTGVMATRNNAAGGAGAMAPRFSSATKAQDCAEVAALVAAAGQAGCLIALRPIVPSRHRPASPISGAGGGDGFVRQIRMNVS